MRQPAQGHPRRHHGHHPTVRPWTWPWFRAAGRRLGVRGWAVLLTAAGAVGLSLLTGFFGLIGDRVFPELINRVVPSPTPPPPLSVRVLQPGEFVARSLAGDEPYLLADGMADPREVPAAALQDSGTYREWAIAHGGQLAGEYAIRLDLRGSTSEPVIIHGLRVRMVSNVPSASKGWFRDPQPGCGGEPVRFAEVHFDRSGPKTTWWDPESGDSVDPPTLTVTSADTETIEVKLSTRVQDVAFQILVLYDASDGSGELAVDGGRTFMLKALSRGTQFYRINSDSDRLVRDSSSDPGSEGWSGGC